MRRAFLFILLCRFLTAQDAAGIQGLAIDAITRQPMPGVHITMRPAAPDVIQNAAYGAISGPDGHFSIANMPPALYFLPAQHNGYVYSPSDARQRTNGLHDQNDAASFDRRARSG